MYAFGTSYLRGLIMTDLHTSVAEPEHACDLNLDQVWTMLNLSRQIFYVYNFTQRCAEYLSPHAGEVLDISTEQMYNMDVLVELKRRVHPDYRQQAEQLMQDMINHTGQTRCFEYQWSPDNDGNYRWVRERATSYIDSRTGDLMFTGCAEDITEFKNMEKQLEDIKQGRPSLLTSIHPEVRELLTRTENTILEMIIEGNSNRTIAQNLHRSVRTVEDHRNHIMHKLGVHNVVELLKAAAGIKR